MGASLPLASTGGLGPASPLLHPGHLQAMLRTCWAFPSAHRLYAWRFALQLPRNERAHRALLAKGEHPECAALMRALPVADRRTGQRLERLLSCLAHWCPLLGQLRELPTTLFPLMDAFGGDDLGAFEACATVLLNWGQSFYEFYPHPPVVILGQAEELLQAHMPQVPLAGLCKAS
jgi:hypothetical protein